MDKGIEGQPISPTAGEVLNVHIGIVSSLPLTPDQKSLFG